MYISHHLRKYRSLGGEPCFDIDCELGVRPCLQKLMMVRRRKRKTSLQTPQGLERPHTMPVKKRETEGVLREVDHPGRDSSSKDAGLIKSWS